MISEPLAEPLLTPKEVGKMLGRSDLWVRQKANAGVLPAVRFAGSNMLRFRRASLDAAFTRLEKKRRPAKRVRNSQESILPEAA